MPALLQAVLVFSESVLFQSYTPVLYSSTFLLYLLSAQVLDFLLAF